MSIRSLDSGSRQRRALLMLLALLAIWVTAACGGGDDDGGTTTGTGVKVVATTTQIGALTREVAGDEVELTVLLSAGADAHDYEPSPKAVAQIKNAQVVLVNGIGLDAWLDDVISGAGAERVVMVTDGIAIREADAEHGDDEGDPHVWHDPGNVKLMVDNIAAALSEADPEKAATFEANSDAYKAKLDAVDVQIRALIDSIPAENRKIVTNHDSFGYFFDRYEIEFVGAIIPGTSKDAQPSAKDLADLTDLIKREGVKAIFAEEEVDPKVARQLAADTGVAIVTGLYADSLGAPGSGAETVDGMLLSNATKIAEALR
ncbi:MAG: zinc ABC transporter substrate-binding protein [Dehalococcoidia bacterium]|nr:zinc ABC transporter substrate-binding protein [Dehalococcoidia bacterium]